jgi:hypothetical protein
MNPGAVPVVTVSTFGAGKSAVLAFDPAVSPTHAARATLEGLFKRTVEYVAPATARVPAGGQVVGLAFTLVNNATTSQLVDLSVVLPVGVTTASADDGATVADPPTWQLTLAAGESRRVRFSVALPDTTGTYTIGSSFKVGGVTRTSPQFDLVIARSSGQEIADAVAALQALTPPAASEVAARNRAVTFLSGALGVASDPALADGRVRLGVAADDAMGTMTGAALGPIRRDVSLAVAAWARDWFEGNLPITEPLAVRPIFECVKELPASQYQAFFGYQNDNATPWPIPIGDDNKFTPTPIDRGQPILFQPGRTAAYPNTPFSVVFSGNTTLVWKVLTQTATASKTSARCH